MIVGKFNLTPNEKKRYTVEYSDWLDSGETIISQTFTVEEITVPPLVISGDLVDAGGTLLSYFVNGGISNQLYDVTIKVTTSNGQIKEDSVLYSVKDAT